jgi:hypothetical protein
MNDHVNEWYWITLWYLWIEDSTDFSQPFELVTSYLDFIESAQIARNAYSKAFICSTPHQINRMKEFIGEPPKHHNIVEYWKQE